jgi:hypothetical protein
MDQTLLYPETELVRDTPVKLSLGDHHYLLLWPEVSFCSCFVIYAYIELAIWHSKHRRVDVSDSIRIQ